MRLSGNMCEKDGMGFGRFRAEAGFSYVQIACSAIHLISSPV